jgi:hypothetical protein
VKQESPYNPLDKKNLGISVADALLARPVQALPPEEQFNGAGIYAIYYTGVFPAYRAVAEANRDGQFKIPIYVGKAVPAGARKGGFGLDAPPGSVLYKRLCEHAESIKSIRNLSSGSFFCRYLVVDDIWIPLGEALLIGMFNPVWNKLIDGFGNHDPGKGRYNQQRSPWDVLHPGRPWAGRLRPGPKSADRLCQMILQSFEEPRP